MGGGGCMCVHADILRFAFVVAITPYHMIFFLEEGGCSDAQLDACLLVL